MRAVDIIRKKRDGQTLTNEEIECFVCSSISGTWPDYQVSALLMAIYCRGMNNKETAALTSAMVHSGARLNLEDIPGFKVDKHSTGGVGDKTSPIIVPLAACLGCVVPKMSGRGLGHTGGTLDKLESIPGFRADLSNEELRSALRRNGCVLMGQTKAIAPGDKVLYSLRDVTATVESIPLITSSIMSKKIAEGIEGLVLDVKFGAGAFMKDSVKARELARALVETGKASGVQTVAYLTAMHAPLGQAIGNALEMRECFETLKGNGPKDLEQLCIVLAARMIRLADAKLTPEESEKRVHDTLSSGVGLEKLRNIIQEQGGDGRVVEDYHLLPRAPKQDLFRSSRRGFIQSIDAERLGNAAMILGAGREKKQDPIDHGVGMVVKVKVGDEIKEGESLAEIHYREEKKLAIALEYVHKGIVIGEEKPAPEPLIIGTVES